MSVHLSHTTSPEQDHENQSVSTDEDDKDQSWDDFADDSIAQQPCLSLFEEKHFRSVTDAVQNDISKHQFDLNKTCNHLGKCIYRSFVRRP